MKYLVAFLLAACASQSPRKPSSANGVLNVAPGDGGSEITAALKAAKPPLKLRDGKLATGDVYCASGFDMSPTACMFANPDGSPGPRVTNASAQGLWKLFDDLKRRAYLKGELDQLGIDSIECTPEGSCTVTISPTGGAPERGGLL